MSANIQAFFDPDTSTITYIVADPASGACAVIDPVLDYDAASARTGRESVDRVIAAIQDQGLKLQWILETHAHADHLSAAPLLREALGGQIAIGEHIREVQGVFSRLFNLSADFPTDGRQFDHLFRDGEEFQIGELQARVIYTPGHTPACVSYLIDDAVFVGDTLFMPDHGTARADFPGGDARDLYRSIQKIYALPDSTRMFMCHDYQPGGREPRWETTVAEQKAENRLIHTGISEDEFVADRQARDKELAAPRLILPSLQVNIAAGNLPPADDNGVSYLRLPLNQLGR